MKTLAILAALLLSSCAALDAIFGPDDWEPTGHMTVPGMVGANGGTMGPHHLYRPNPNEKPRIVKVEVAEGKTLDVQVYAYRCVAGDTQSAYSMGHIVYLCGKKGMEKHELAHSAGMKHTPWVHTGVAVCATITQAGYKTGYVVGKEVCVANDFEMVSK